MTTDTIEEKEKNNWTLTLPLLPRHNSHTIRRRNGGGPLQEKTGITQS